MTSSTRLRCGPSGIAASPALRFIPPRCPLYPPFSRAIISYNPFSVALFYNISLNVFNTQVSCEQKSKPQNVNFFAHTSSLFSYTSDDLRNILI